MILEHTYQDYAGSGKLECSEWDRIWFEKTYDKDAKRVIYIGDSISQGTFDNANKMTDGKILFNRLGTSKALDNPYFYPLVKMFIDQCERRDAIIFNNGLHGWHLSEEEYKEYYAAFLKKLRADYSDTPIYIVLTTDISDARANRPRVSVRNEKALELAEEFGLEVIDLYTVSQENASLHTDDGVHFTPEGYAVLAGAVVDFLKERI